jgi:hypothetical protein
MQHLKMVGLSLAAVALMTALVGVGTASAASFYAGNKTLGVGSKIVESLVGSTTVKDTSGNVVLTCTEDSFETEITNAGGLNKRVKRKLIQHNFKCTATPVVLKGGEIETSWTSGLNGSDTETGFEETDTILGVSCAYGTGTEATLGTITGTESGEATETDEGVLSKTSGGFLCPPTLVWMAKYTVTAPLNFNVRAQ